MKKEDKNLQKPWITSKLKRRKNKKQKTENVKIRNRKEKK